MTNPRARCEERLVPEPLQELESWVLWNGRDKVPLAPWVTGDMFPAGWGDGVVADPESRMEERPETDYETARSYAEIPPPDLHHSYSFPNADDGTPDIPERVIPTVMLPHYPPDPPLMQVDFDDVRDPDTGEVSREVFELVRELDAFTEISVSGEGLHLYVRAELPGRLGKFIADLDEIGAIELYDHGRFTACTWKHVAGTPESVPERQGVVKQIIERYESESQKQRRVQETTEPDVDDVLASIRGQEGAPPSTSEYYRLDCRDVADTGDFSSYRTKAPGNDWEGPHPEHGPEHSDKDDCTNFAVEPDENVWFCRADGVGGGSLSLIAVLEGLVQCEDAKRVYRDNSLLLEACVHAKENYSAALDEADPPYGALVELAERHDLVMADANEGILGEDAWRIARIIFENTDVDEL